MFCASALFCLVRKVVSAGSTIIQDVARAVEGQHSAHAYKAGSFLLFYEDLKSQPRETLQSLLTFLGMDHSFKKDEVGFCD